jgi:Tol biopolymer transport system component
MRGPIPLVEMLRVGVQIAAALEMAHRQGIVHRDLKPGNIMLTSSGAKLLDFGLAKGGAFSAQSSSGIASAAHGEQQDRTAYKPLTEEGTILGTFQYMAPEQLEGAEADARSDIFSFGAVLYEMATGKKAFDGKTRTSLIAAIVDRDPPPISEIQPMTPPAFERLVRVCLRKDPNERWQTAHDVKLELEWIGEGGSAAGIAAPVIARRKSRERLAWGIAALLLITTVAAALYGFARAREARGREPIRAQIVAPEGTRFDFYGPNIGSLSIAPDGSRLAFVAGTTGARRTIWVRPLRSAAAQPLAGTEGAQFPFWSPDSRSIAFFADGKLKKIEASGGAPFTICDAIEGRGGTWNRDGVIVFAPETQTGLSRVAAAGGTPAAITKISVERSETTHRYPHFLPDGEHFLYFRGSHAAPSQDKINSVWVRSLDGKTDVELLNSPSGAIYAGGHLLYAQNGFVMARPFDEKALKILGDPFTVGERVPFLPDYFTGAFAASNNGILVLGQGHASAMRLVWKDRAGEELSSAGDPARYGPISLSPDGGKAALTVSDESGNASDIWIHDLTRNVRSRLTFDERNDTEPVWSPDGKTIAFGSQRSGKGDIYVRSALGGGAERLLVATEDADSPASWSPDGQHLLFNRSIKGNDELWVMPLSGDRKPFPIVQSPFDEGWARFSPDGKWVAYVSNESGRYELYATRFPAGEGKWQLSAGGADWLVGWRSDGKEIYYLDLEGNMMAVAVETGEAIEAQIPVKLFSMESNQTWASSADGKRFLVGRPDQPSLDLPLMLVVDWVAEAK